jgi:transcriptional regulator with XRE-family HTH domain
MPTKLAEIDSYAFANDVVSGRYTRRQIAERHGISPSLVAKIVHGKRRPDVTEAIGELLDATDEEIRHKWLRLRGDAVDTLAKAMRGEATGPAVTAAKEVLNRTDSESAPDADLSAHIEQTLMDLSEKTKRLVIEELDGPER